MCIPQPYSLLMCTYPSQIPIQCHAAHVCLCTQAMQLKQQRQLAATPSNTTTATTAEEKRPTQYNNVTSNILYNNADDPVVGGRALNSGIVDTPAVIACLVVISLLVVIIVVLVAIITRMRLQTSKPINETTKQLFHGLVNIMCIYLLMTIAFDSPGFIRIQQ